MKIKKFLALGLALLMLFSLAACNNAEKTAEPAPAATPDATPTPDAAPDTDAAPDAAPAAGETYQVCFVARASADTFAPCLTSEMQKNAAAYE